MKHDVDRDARTKFATIHVIVWRTLIITAANHVSDYSFSTCSTSLWCGRPTDMHPGCCEIVKWRALSVITVKAAIRSRHTIKRAREKESSAQTGPLLIKGFVLVVIQTISWISSSDVVQCDVSWMNDFTGESKRLLMLTAHYVWGFGIGIPERVRLALIIPFRQIPSSNKRVGTAENLC